MIRRMTEPPTCAIVLAAGEGQRLRPLTLSTPKALCPVGNVPLLDRALAWLAGHGFAGPDRVAVNACYLGDQVVAHVGGRAHVSVEVGKPLGTGGGVANLRDWIDGRGVLVVNADAYLAGADPGVLLAGWDGATVRILAVPAGDRPAEFGRSRFAGASLLPWSMLAALEPGYSELVLTVWRPAERAGRLATVGFPGTYLDTGTPTDYLAANLHAAGGGNLVAPDARVSGRLDSAVVGAGAVVEGTVTRGVVWPGGYVGPGEHLTDAVRVGTDLTVHR
jgi:NDP-sugar pyrophosphorylase family protein